MPRNRPRRSEFPRPEVPKWGNSPIVHIVFVELDDPTDSYFYAAIIRRTRAGVWDFVRDAVSEIYTDSEGQTSTEVFLPLLYPVLCEYPLTADDYEPFRWADWDDSEDFNGVHADNALPQPGDTGPPYTPVALRAYLSDGALFALFLGTDHYMTDTGQYDPGDCAAVVS